MKCIETGKQADRPCSLSLFKAIVVIALLLAALFSQAAWAQTIQIDNWDDLSDEIEKIPDGGSATFELTGNFAPTSEIIIPRGKNVTIVSDGTPREIKRSRAYQRLFFNVQNGGSLTLGAEGDAGKGVKLDGGYTNASSTKSYTSIIFTSGTLTIYDGVYIQNNYNGEGDSGGVYVHSGTFTMNGGSISGNTANTSTSTGLGGGGGVFVYGGTFTMNGGSIFGNEAEASRAPGGGGGVCVIGGEFKMNGGSIVDNEAYGDKNAYGGGVCIDGPNAIFTMTGGSVSGNKANDGGGGVYFADGTFSVEGTPAVYSNTSGWGATLKNDNISLPDGMSITIMDDGLTTGAQLGVTTMTAPVSGTPVNITDEYSDTLSNQDSYFFSDGVYSVAEVGGATGKKKLQLTADIKTADSWQGLKNIIEEVDSAGTRVFSGKIILADGAAGADYGFDTTDIGSISIARNQEITLISKTGQSPFTISRGSGHTSEFFDVDSGGSLTLGEKGDAKKGVILDGGSENDTPIAATAPLITVYSGNLTINDGVSIQNNINDYSAGVSYSGYGGGVFVQGGTFTMHGGSISGNTANRGTSNRGRGGGVYVQGGTFTMKGGSVTGNTASGNGGGVYVLGSGTFFTMNDGSITGNTASGDGGGVFIGSATFTMNGGEIKGNTATKGGSVLIETGMFTMNSGEIKGNTATNGGGVYVSGATVASIFTMTGGSVTGNTASGDGGGVYVTSGNAKFTMTGGSVTGNTASVNGGGVYVYYMGTFNVSGTAKVYDNAAGTGANVTDNNIYLPNNSVINISDGDSRTSSDTLSNGAQLGVTTEKEPTTGNVDITGEYAETLLNQARYFIADGVYGVVEVPVAGNSKKLQLTAAIDTVRSWQQLLNKIEEEDSSGNRVFSGKIILEDGDATAPFGFKTTGNDTTIISPISIGKNQNITLISKKDQSPFTIGRGIGHTNEFFIVEIDGSLTLGAMGDVNRGVILDGTEASDASTIASLIKTEGEVVINEGVSIQNNKNTGDFGGGGVYVDNGGKLSMNGGSIENNSSEKNGGGVCLSKATFTMDGGNISGNKSLVYGGGVYSSNNSTFTINGGDIYGNESSDAGGGVHSRGSAFTMNDGDIHDNSATGNGGGVCSRGSAFTMNGGRIYDNSATRDGGGVHVDVSNNTFNLNGGSIYNNSTVGLGGGVYVADGTFNASGTPAVTGNTSQNKVDNIYLPNGKTINLTGDGLTGSAKLGVTTQTEPTDTTVVDFTSEYANTLPNQNSYFKADGVYRVAEIPGTDTSKKKLQLTVETADSWEELKAKIEGGSPKFSGRIVLGDGDSNDGYNGFPTTGGTDGGPITIADGQSITLVSLAAQSDFMIKRGSGHTNEFFIVSPNGSLTLGESGNADKGVALDGGYNSTASSGIEAQTPIITTRGEITINGGVSLQNNKNATGKGGGAGVINGGLFTMNGGRVCNNTSNSNGGGVYIDAKSQASALIMSGDATICDNAATVDGGGVYIESNNNTIALEMKNNATINNNTATVDGGGVYLQYGTLNMYDNTTISNNTATVDGGGVCIDNGTVAMFGGTVCDNTANGNGGGAYLQDGSFYIMSLATILRNTASNNGGGVYLQDGTFIISSIATICDNTAKVNGGGVYLQGGKFDIASDATISDNTAVDGGGVYLQDGTFIISSIATICNNTATNNGGGVYLQGGTFNIYNDATIYLNTATVDGGGVYMEGGTADMSDSATIDSNKAIKNGGGVYLLDGAFEMSDSAKISSNNTTNGNGGGVYMEGGTFSMSDGAISENDALYGGGIYLLDGAFEMSGGVIGGENTADANSALNGGGAHVIYGTLTMSGGKITGNIASYADDNFGGGGVYLYSGTLNMSGNAAISGNRSNGVGGGVYLDNGTLNVSGTPVVKDNTTDNVYLSDGRTITVSSPLTPGAELCVTTEIAPTSGVPVKITEENDDDYSEFFISEDDEFKMESYRVGSQQAVYLVAPAPPVLTLRITYNTNGGTGYMADGAAVPGVPFTLPHCDFTPPAGMRFGMWAVGSAAGERVKAGDTYTFTEATTLYAIWEGGETKPTITTKDLLWGVAGEYYAQNIVAAGTKPMTWSVAGELPQGLSLNTDTGAIRGTPAAAETREITVTAQNAYGSDSKTYTIAILQEPKTPEPFGSGFISNLLALEKGSTLKLLPPSGYAGRWRSSDTTIATIDDNQVLTALKTGTVMIYFEIGAKAVFVGDQVILELHVVNEGEAVKKVSVEPNKPVVAPGERLSLTASVSPATALYKQLTWTSADVSIATVDDNGVIKGVSSGKTKITATSTSGVKKAVEVVVTDEVKSVSLNKTKQTIGVGGTAQLIATVTPLGASDKSITWSSDKQNVATVDANGLVKGVAQGKAIITATASNGVKAKATITVQKDAVPAQTYTLTVQNGRGGGDYEEGSKVSVAANPPEEGMKFKEWVVVSGGITLSDPTSENITITMPAEAAQLRATYEAATLEGIFISPDARDMLIGDGYTVKLIKQPAAAPLLAPVTWSSGNESVATVDEHGVVTAISLGYASITAKSGEFTATCFINVIPESDAPKLTLSVDKLAIQKNKALKLTNLAGLAGAWSTSDSGVAFINAKGALKAKKLGAATLTFTVGVAQKGAKFMGKSVVAGDEITIDLFVVAKGEAVKKLTAKPSSLILAPGDEASITTSVAPKKAVHKEVYFRAGDEGVAVVDEFGNVKAIGVGETTITATATSGVFKTVPVVVSDSVVKLTLNSTKKSLKAGKTFQLSLKSYLPASLHNPDITWSSSKPDVATVDAKGLVTAVKKGKTTITATSSTGAKATCKVTVK